MAIKPDIEIILPEVLLDAYCQGIFPMADDGKILWFAPTQRGLIPLDERFHISRGLRKSLRKQPFEIRFNTAFREVMQGCAARSETWIDATILESYCLLHERGYAHSVECWDAEGLQGGLYGVALPGVFCGESMFSRKTDASKIALVALVEKLRGLNFKLLDTQWQTEHLKQFGCYEVSRKEYERLLQQALAESA